jgi:hypothetical protein
MPAAGEEGRNMFRTIPSGLRIIALVLVTAVVLVGCSVGAGTGGAPSPVDPASTAGLTAISTPSPTPVPVEELFADQLRELDSASGSISGEMTVGDLEIPIDGGFAFHGRDAKMRVRFRVDGQEQVTERISIANETFERQGAGPWLLEPSSAAAEGLNDVLKSLRKLQPAGTVTKDGRPLYRLRVPPGTKVDFASLVPPGATDAKVEVELLVDESGNLVVTTLDMSWTQVGAGRQVDVDAHLDFEIEEVPSMMKIERPAEVWVPGASTAQGYAYALPDDWEVTENPDGLVLQGPAANTIVTFSAEIERGTTLNDWTRALIEHNRRDISPKPESNKAGTVAGQPARVLTYHATIEGNDVYIVECVFIRAGRAYEVAWFSTPGSEATDRALFDRFLAQMSFPMANGRDGNGTI